MSRRSQPEASPDSGPIVLGPCAQRFTSAEQLRQRLSVARTVTVMLPEALHVLLMRIGTIEYAGWEPTWILELEKLNLANLPQAIETLNLFGLINVFGDRVSLTQPGCLVWAELDATRDQPPRVCLSLDAAEDAALQILEQQGPMTAAELIAATGHTESMLAHALQRLTRMQLIEQGSNQQLRCAVPPSC